MSDNRAQRMMRDHNVAKRVGKRVGVERARTKALMYLRVRRLAEDIGVAPTEAADVCHCERADYSHLHQFGSVVPVTHHRTGKAVADSVVARHNWHDKGTKRVFKSRTRDHKNRKCVRTRVEVAHQTTLADTLRRNLKILENPKLRADQRKRAALKILEIVGSVEIPQKQEKQEKYRAIWKNALRRRRK